MSSSFWSPSTHDIKVYREITGIKTSQFAIKTLALHLKNLGFFLKNSSS
jgi:hypothetical protein